MAKTIKKHKDLIFITGIGLFIALVGIMGMYNMAPSNIDTVEAATTANVSVTATVQEWISITASSTATLTPDLVDVSGNTAIASSTDLSFIAKSNSADGYTVTVQGDGGNALDSGGNSIASVPDATTTTITAGTDGYGIQATSTESLSVKTNYDNWGNNTLGPIRGSQEIVDHNGPTDSDGHVTSFRIAAACDDQQASGTYSDTVTFTITASP